MRKQVGNPEDIKKCILNFSAGGLGISLGYQGVFEESFSQEFRSILRKGKKASGP
jgi:hypothetical protein